MKFDNFLEKLEIYSKMQLDKCKVQLFYLSQFSCKLLMRYSAISRQFSAIILLLVDKLKLKKKTRILKIANPDITLF